MILAIVLDNWPCSVFARAQVSLRTCFTSTGADAFRCCIHSTSKRWSDSITLSFRIIGRYMMTIREIRFLLDIRTEPAGLLDGLPLRLNIFFPLLIDFRGRLAFYPLALLCLTWYCLMRSTTAKSFWRCSSTAFTSILTPAERSRSACLTRTLTTAHRCATVR